MTGCRVLLNGAPVAWRSSMQKHVTLSVTEAEMGAGMMCAGHTVCLQSGGVNGFAGTATYVTIQTFARMKVKASKSPPYTQSKMLYLIECV